MLEAQDDLAIILTAEMGKPLAEARGEIVYGASFIEWFAEEGKRIYGETVPGHQPDKRITVIRQPIGIVGAITPANFPNAMITRKAGPGFGGGLCIIVKPAEDTPLSALALAVLAERAVIPAGLFSVLPASDGREIGLEFCENHDLRKLCFTGSTEVGRILLRQAADQVMKCSMELGGNAPFIVFDDADLDAAVAGAMVCKFRNNGQTCVCANRIYVQDGVYDAFAAKLTEAVNAQKLGDGMEDGVTLGPVINEDGLAKIESHVADAVEKGAQLLTGGARSALGGTYYEPTVLASATQQMRFLLRKRHLGPWRPSLTQRGRGCGDGE